jgi:hypothetical protein
MPRNALITLALILGTSSTAAAPQARPGDIIVEGNRAARDKTLCKRSVPTGSILRATTCKTRGEWEEQRQRDVAALETIQRALEIRRDIRDVREGTEPPSGTRP